MKTRELKKLIVFILTFAIILSQMVIFVYADDEIDAGDYFVSLRMDGTIGVNLYINYSWYDDKFTTSPVITLSYPDETTKVAASISEKYSTVGAGYEDGQIKDVSNVYDVNQLKSDTVSADEAYILGNSNIAGWSKISCAVAPALINNKITFVVSDGSDKTYEHSFTVKEIAKKYIDKYSEPVKSVGEETTKETAEKIVALCRSLLSYGDAAYTYFSGQLEYGFAEAASGSALFESDDAEKYYNAPLATTKSAVDSVEGNPENTVTVEDYDKEFEIVKASLASIGYANHVGSTYAAVENITMGGFSFTCVSNTYMRYKFKMTESAAGEGETVTYAAVVNFTNNENASISALNSKISAEVSVDDESSDSHEYSIRVKGIPAVCLGEEYVVSLNRYVLNAEHATIEDSKGSEIYSFSGSAMAYANRVFCEGYADGTDTAENLRLEKIMMMAAYRYYLAASDYFSIAR